MEPNLSTPTGQAYASPTGQITPTSGSNTLTPEVFKAGVMKSHPEYEKAIASDGTPYASMDATDFTKRFAQKYPDAITKAGNKYSDYLPPEQSTQDNSQTSQSNFIQGLAQNIAQPFLQGARLPLGLAEQGLGKLTGNQAMIQQGADMGGNKSFDFGYLGKVNQTGYDAQGNSLGFGGSLQQAVGAGLQIAPYAIGAGEVGSLVDGAGSQTIGSLAKAGAQTGATLGGLSGVGQGLQTGAENNQDLATTAGNTLLQGGEGAISGGLLGGVLGLGSGILGKLTGKIGADVPVRESIDAVNPDLNGKKLSSSYEKGAFQGKIKPSSSFGVQEVSPSNQVLNLGKSLSDIGLKSSPGEAANNLIKIGKAMQDTESKITPFNETPVSNGIKRTVVTELDSLKSQVPQEFIDLKNTSPRFDKVIDYAKKLVNKTDNTIGGYRNTRGSFYDSLKTQFPSAFDDQGRFNIKTPEGAAGKMVYDHLNQNLFDIAPKKSNLPGLIKREGDLFQAAKNIAPKAKAMDGLSGFSKFVKSNPGLIKTLKLGAEISGVGGVAGLVGSHLLGGSK